MRFQQTVNDELRRTYRQIASNITLQESQINMLTNDFENPILHAQRKNLSQLQVHKWRKCHLVKLRYQLKNIKIIAYYFSG